MHSELFRHTRIIVKKTQTAPQDGAVQCTRIIKENAVKKWKFSIYYINYLYIYIYIVTTSRDYGSREVFLALRHRRWSDVKNAYIQHLAYIYVYIVYIHCDYIICTSAELYTAGENISREVCGCRYTKVFRHNIMNYNMIIK